MKRPNQRVRMGVVVAVTALLVITALAHVAPLSRSQTDGQRTATDVKLVRVDDGSQRLWPYTSRRHDFNALTLPINVVVDEDADTVYRLLTAGYGGTTAEWETTNPKNETIVLNGTETSWRRSHGATRYTYVETRRGGQWLDESYQVHEGSYFGTRVHLRLYDGGTKQNQWTAIQAHAEHWDWFRLRHTVSGLAEARQFVERDFYGTYYLHEIERVRYANGGILDADGWISSIRVADWTTIGPQTLGPVVVALGFAFAGVPAALRETWEQSRVDSQHLLLFGLTAALPVAVRIAGILLERHTLLANTPKVITALLFPVLAVGLPAVAYRFGRELRTVDGFALTVLGFGVGVLADYAFLDIAVVPIPVVLHRAVLAVALGLLAAGGVRWDDDWFVRHRYSVVGGVVWVAALLWTLLGFA